MDSKGDFDGDVSDAEVYFSAGLLKPGVLDRVLDAAPAVRWQHTPSAGVNHLFTPTSLARNLILTNGAGVHAIPIAEFVLALMLDRVYLALRQVFPVVVFGDRPLRSPTLNLWHHATIRDRGNY